MKYKIEIKKNYGKGYTIMIDFFKERGEKYKATYTTTCNTKKEAKEWEANHIDWLKSTAKNLEKV